MFEALGRGMALEAAILAISIFTAGWIVGRLSRPYRESEAFWRGVEHGQSVERHRGKGAPAPKVEVWDGQQELTPDPAEVLRRA
jgi:hypothetical protein